MYPSSRSLLPYPCSCALRFGDLFSQSFRVRMREKMRLQKCKNNNRVTANAEQRDSASSQCLVAKKVVSGEWSGGDKSAGRLDNSQWTCVVWLVTQPTALIQSSPSLRLPLSSIIDTTMYSIHSRAIPMIINEIVMHRSMYSARGLLFFFLFPYNRRVLCITSDQIKASFGEARRRRHKKTIVNFLIVCYKSWRRKKSI